MRTLRQLFVAVPLLVWTAPGWTSTLTPAVFSYEYQISPRLELGITDSGTDPNFIGPEIVQDGTSTIRTVSNVTIQAVAWPRPAVRIRADGEAKDGQGFVIVRSRASIQYQVELRRLVPGAPSSAEVDVDFEAWIDLVSPEFTTPAPNPVNLGLLEGLIQFESFGLSYVHSKRIGSSRGCAGIFSCEVTDSYYINTFDARATRAGPGGRPVSNDFEASGLPRSVFMGVDAPQTLTIWTDIELESGAVEDFYAIDTFIDPVFRLSDPSLVGQLEIVVSANVGNGEPVGPAILFDDGFEP